MRQYIARENFDKRGLLVITGKDFRYFKQVLRLSAGDMVTVRETDGNLRNATVCKVCDADKTITLQLCAETDGFEAVRNMPSSEDETEYWLFMFVPKSSKFDQIVRQCTECGVKRIIPVKGEFSQYGSDRMNFKADRFERIIKEARQQSGSATETVVDECVTVSQACELWKQNDMQESFGCLLYERTENTAALHSALSGDRKIKKCAVVCGAEGGISPSEIDEFMKCGFVPVHFETNILRCETAALYGIAAVQNALTEKKLWQCKE